MNKEYRKFPLSKLFDFSPGNVDLQQRDINGRGEYFINSGETNQGIKGKTDIEAKIFPENTITIDFWGNAYYRDFKYKLATHNHVFSLSGDVIKNKEIGLYLVALMSRFPSAFSYNNMATQENLKEMCIMLPVNSLGQIDYAYMEDYIRQLEEDYIRQLEAYMMAAGLDDYNLTEREKECLVNTEKGNVSYKKFRIDDIFSIDTGKDFIVGASEEGPIPLISHQHTDNGIAKYVQERPDCKKFNCRETLSLADRGIFRASVQCMDFYIGTRVKALTFLDGEKSEEARLFVAASINKLQECFLEYLVNATDKLPDLEISLPVDSTGKIDYEYMEQYITVQKKLTISGVVKWKNREIEKTKTLICE